MEECGGVWRVVEGCGGGGGAWRAVVGCGGWWRSRDDGEEGIGGLVGERGVGEGSRGVGRMGKGCW